MRESARAPGPRLACAPPAPSSSAPGSLLSAGSRLRSPSLSRADSLPRPRALPSSLGRSSRRRARAVGLRARPPPPGSLPGGRGVSGGLKGGATRGGATRGGRGREAGPGTLGQSPATAQTERKRGGARGPPRPPRPRLLAPCSRVAWEPRAEPAGREAPYLGEKSPERAGWLVPGPPRQFGKVHLILHAFLRTWSPAPAPSRERHSFPSACPSFIHKD